MMLKTHLAFSFLFGLFLYPLFKINQILFFIIFLFCSILPDIDITTSKIGATTKPLSNIINLLFSHRGFFHSIFPPLIVLFVFYYFGYITIGIIVFLGYLSHLIMDSFTKTGIMFFQPLHNFRIRGFFTVGGFFEYLLFFLLLGACAWKLSLF